MTQPDMNAIMQQAQEMQAQLQAAQQEILKSSVNGEAGNGLVKIELAGSGEINDLTIDPSVVDANDVETLQDLIIGAFKDANKNLQALAEDKMGPLSQGMNSLGL